MIYFTGGWDDSPLPQVPEHVTKLFGLILNPMRGRTEEARFLAASENKQELIDLLQRETVPSYQDDNWRKQFMKGGPLEWFNPPTFPDRADDWGHGIIELSRDGWRRVA